MTLTGVDAQHLETRRPQTDEVCRAFRVFPHMIGHAERSATYASAEQFFMAHVVHSLAPWVERFEQAAECDLIDDETDQGDFEVVAKMSLQSMMRGDAKARADFYASAIVNGWMTRAEARDLEDLPMLPGLDVRYAPYDLPGSAIGDFLLGCRDLRERCHLLVGHDDHGRGLHCAADLPLPQGREARGAQRDNHPAQCQRRQSGSPAERKPDGAQDDRLQKDDGDHSQ